MAGSNRPKKHNKRRRARCSVGESVGKASVLCSESWLSAEGGGGQLGTLP